MKKNRMQEKGFTLVEIAIVLTIIGLLLGGVLKGQEMIENARIKSITNDLNGVSGAYNAYVDRYRALPGDETLAVMTNRGWTATVGGNANGVLALAANTTFTNGGEQASFWQALRAAGFLAGDPTQTLQAALPRTGTGGLIGVAGTVYGLSGIEVCAAGLTTRQAAGVDGLIDGANAANNTGNARAATGAANPLAPVAAAPAATAYNESTVATTWTLCRPI